MYRVVRVTELGFSGNYSTDMPVVDGIETRESALVLAEVAASEHADRIDVKYAACGNLRSEHTGFTFRTNNGTQVWYVIRKA